MTDTKHSADLPPLPKWIDDQKGKDPLMDDMIQYIEQQRAAIAAAAPAGEPVAYCSPNAKGLSEFGKGWMFSPVPQLMATMPLYAAPVPAAAPKAALTDAQKRAASLFTCWWSMIEAENELADKPLDGESVALHYMGCGASCMVHVKDLREVCAMLRNISDASGPNAALVAILKKYWKGDYFDAVSRSDVEVIEAALAAAGVKS